MSRHLPSPWTVLCEGCRWTATFGTGNEADEAAWAHHRDTHHSIGECPPTRIFRATARADAVAVARQAEGPHNQTSGDGQPAEAPVPAHVRRGREADV